MNVTSRKPPSARPMVALATAALLGIAVPPAMAQAPIPASVEQQLGSAAANGPAALLRSLDQALRDNPSLAATPDGAVALARAAGTPVSGFVGATLPTYRAIADRIAAAAPATQAQAVREAVAAELGRIAATDARPAPIQGAPGTRTGESVGQRGYRAGGFMIYPDIQFAAIHDSNIYASRSRPRADWIGTVSPKLSVESDWERHSLTASVQMALAGYARSPRENSIDWNARVEGRIDATDATQVVLGAIQIAGHEDRTSPDAVNGFSPTPYRETNAYLGVLHRMGDFAIRLGGAFERTVFDNVDGANGVINNHDRDRNRFTFGGLVRYEANQAFRPFVEALGDVRTYDQTRDDFGFARSSNGYRVGAGALFRLSRTLRGDVFLGAMGRKADDPRFTEQVHLALDASLRWQVRPGTTAVVYVERSMEETTLLAASGYVHTVVGGRIEQRLTDRLSGLVRVGYGYSDFLQSPRADRDVDASVGLRYRLNETVSLGVDYRFTQRASNVPGAGFDRNLVYFRVGTQF